MTEEQKKAIVKEIIRSIRHPSFSDGIVENLEEENPLFPGRRDVELLQGVEQEINRIAEGLMEKFNERFGE